MNQTLARSMNTSLVAILPVLAVLVIGAQLLGATTLQYFGLALVIGLTSGAYSSIFIASPVLSGFKEREPRYVSIRRKLANRTDRAGLLTPRQAAMLAVAGGPSGVRSGAGGQRAKAGPARGNAAVLRPGAAATRKTQPAPAADDFDDADGLDGDVTPLRRTGSGAAGGGAANGSGRSGASGSGARRPPPRPRKGKGGKKGGRRR